MYGGKEGNDNNMFKINISHHNNNKQCVREREREEKDMYLRHGYGTRNGVSEIAFVGWIRIFSGAFMRIYSQTIRSQSGQETSSRGSAIWELCTQ
jgi:hypothetical protein